LPPPRFSTGELLEKDVDFCYGSCYNSLWLYIDRIHGLDLRYDNSGEAIDQRKRFLIDHNIGICDIVASCEREKVDASDLGMTNVKLRNLIGYLEQFPKVNTLLFIGGNSRNGPEYFFRKHIKDYGLKLELQSYDIPRVYEFTMPGDSRTQRRVRTVSLTSSSGSANRAIGSMPLYRELRSANPNFTTFDFRVMQYREYL
jgi:G:T/U-mismatch repair DNA glycosylase